MECARIEAVIAGGGEEFSEHESEALLAHLEACSTCSEAFASAEADLDRLALLFEPPPVAAAEWERIAAALAAAAAPPPVPAARPAALRLPRWSGLLLAAAAILLAVAILLLAGQPPGAAPLERGAPAGVARATATATPVATPVPEGPVEPVAPVEEPQEIFSAASVEVEELEAGDGYCTLVRVAPDAEGAALIMVIPLER